MSSDNPYCTVLGIEIPSLERVRDHREAKPFALLLVALLERGAPMTLSEIAQRFEDVGIAPFAAALRSLQCCRPARPPVYRDAEHYTLDPYDQDLDLWALRLGLRPPKGRSRAVFDPSCTTIEALPPRAPTESLTVAELEQAWAGTSLNGWTPHRLAIAVLDAHDEPMPPDDVVEFVVARTCTTHFSTEAAGRWHRGNAVTIQADGRWALRPGHRAIVATRKAVRARLAQQQRRQTPRSSGAEVSRALELARGEREAHAMKLAKLRRALIHAFPPEAPEAAVVVDVGEGTFEYYQGAGVFELAARIAPYDVIGAIEVRSLLRALGLSPLHRRLAELSPPQQTIQLDSRGRTLKLTTAMLCQGSCGMADPLGDRSTLHQYLRRGQWAHIRRRLEADARSLYWLYHYGRLHGGVRLRWGSLDEWLPVPWVHTDEFRLSHLKEQAVAHNLTLEVVAGSAPTVDDPWLRARLCRVGRSIEHGELFVVDDEDDVVYDEDVQLARLLISRLH